MILSRRDENGTLTEPVGSFPKIAGVVGGLGLTYQLYVTRLATRESRISRITPLDEENNPELM